MYQVIAAINRVDTLDPALLRSGNDYYRAACLFLLSNFSLFSSGRLDRKIEFPLPNEEVRAHIMRIHSRKMNVNQDVNFEELSRCTEDFNGAQCKAVCVEAVSCATIPLIIQYSFNISFVVYQRI